MRSPDKRLFQNAAPITTRLGTSRGATRPERATISQAANSTRIEYQRAAKPASLGMAAALAQALAREQPTPHGAKAAIGAEAQERDRKERHIHDVEAQRFLRRADEESEPRIGGHQFRRHHDDEAQREADAQSIEDLRQGRRCDD